MDGPHFFVLFLPYHLFILQQILPAYYPQHSQGATLPATMSSILYLIVIAALVWFWSDSVSARELAIARCQRACKEVDVQLLDQTVRLARITIARMATGRMQLRRHYRYDFSINGQDRYQGRISMLGRRVEHIHLDLPTGTVIVD